MTRVDVTIIGGGPVGLFAAFYAGLRGMSTRIVDSLPELGGQLTALYPEKYVYDMPGFPKILARDLAREMATQGLQFGAETILGHTATTLAQDAEGYTIGTDKGLELPTRTIVVSAGAGAFSPTRIGLAGEETFEGRGLHYGVRDRSQFAGKRLIVVGGGDSALDWCLNLEPIAAEVVLVHRRDQFRAHEDSVAKIHDSGIRLKLWRVVKELHGEGDLSGATLEHTQTKEVERLDADAVIVNIGFKSSLGPLKEWGMTIEKNQIMVDSRFETSLPGVFAVGDVCNFPGKLRLIATGVGEATLAIGYAKQRVDPAAKLFPGHSSEMELPARDANS